MGGRGHKLPAHLLQAPLPLHVLLELAVGPAQLRNGAAELSGHLVDAARQVPQFADLYRLVCPGGEVQVRHLPGYLLDAPDGPGDLPGEQRAGQSPHQRTPAVIQAKA